MSLAGGVRPGNRSAPPGDVGVGLAGRRGPDHGARREISWDTGCFAQPNHDGNWPMVQSQTA